MYTEKILFQKHEFQVELLKKAGFFVKVSNPPIKFVDMNLLHSIYKALMTFTNIQLENK